MSNSVHGNKAELSKAVEDLLVERDLRGMAKLQPALEPGYCLRAAEHLHAAQKVIIGTGFPVVDTFETDGPLGAIALYGALEALGKEVWLACAKPLAGVINDDFRVLELLAFDVDTGLIEAQRRLDELQPDAVVSIERPGLSSDNRYYNMRGEDISARCAVFDYYLSLADCPTIAIGDGGNEIGMGNVRSVVAALDIVAAATECDELLVADVSNWGAYALIAILGVLASRPLLGEVKHEATLSYLSDRGSVDGVTRQNKLSEDGLPVAAGEALLEKLASLCADSARN